MLRIVRGRELIFGLAPDGDEPSVAMDRNSGDYWVLAPEARAIVEAIQSRGELHEAGLVEIMAADLSSDVVARTIQSLCAAYILEERAR
ncbi:MAG: hypothetical protein J0M28_06440 [Thauera sp.]|nr:hypothetical protein [Thauera sp.]